MPVHDTDATAPFHGEIRQPYGDQVARKIMTSVLDAVTDRSGRQDEAVASARRLLGD